MHKDHKDFKSTIYNCT